MDPSLQTLYTTHLRQGLLQADAQQAHLITTLEHLQHHILNYVQYRTLSLVKRCCRPTPALPRGIYLYGAVGRGKSLMMDMFFQTLPITQKRRVHFHAWMQEMHHALHQPSLPTPHRTHIQDPLWYIMREFAKQCYVLCFDELHMTDMADAMILSRVFQALFAHGVITVITSNRAPNALYRDGVNRSYFEGLARLIETHTQVLSLNGAWDYRTQQALCTPPLYLTPLGDQSTASLQGYFHHLTLHHPPEARTLYAYAYPFYLPYSVGDVGMLSFEQLCMHPYGPAHYAVLCEAFRVLCVTNIPILQQAHHNEAKRFVTFVDQCYEHHGILLCSAAALPTALYAGGMGHFEFQRTASRLMEMQSEAYIRAHHPDIWQALQAMHG